MNYHELSQIFHEFIFILPTVTDYQIQYTICIKCIISKIYIILV